VNRFSQPLPHWVSSTPLTWALGMARASERSRPRISASAGGSRSPDSIETSCPTFIAAPRSLASWSATRRALPGVSSRSLSFGRLPLRQLTGALGNHAAGNARGHPAETGQAGAATAWHGEGGRG
jgi:hypothetical protein